MRINPEREVYMNTTRLNISILFIAIAIVCASWTAQATVLTTTRVASGLELPLFVSSPPQNPGTLFILEQHTGKIKILRNGAVLPTPFLNIQDRVSNSGSERGLLGLAFHPDYSINGYFYVDYTNTAGNTVISRFHVSANPDIADPNSETILLPITQPFSNHNGGMLAFGPFDGYLYIGMGDGGSGGDPGNRAQNDNDLLGKILRIDVDNGPPYGIPPGNPYVGIQGKRAEIWAKGVRNPWRFSFDRQTGDLYIADVGQDAWEEIDFEPASSPGGVNYGWRLMEGEHCYNPSANCDQGGLTYPIHEYSHSIGCSITGGYIYRGRIMPQVSGTYYFADYCSNQIWSFGYANDSVSNFTERTSELAPGGGLSIGSISSFGEDGYGEIYITDLDGGEIFKIVPRNPGVIRGRVTNSLNQPVAGVIVMIRQSAKIDTTDANGQFSLTGLGDGSFDVRYSHPEYRDSTYSGVIVTPGDTSQANMILALVTDINDQNAAPSNFELYQNYPNPFNATTKIEYVLGSPSKVNLYIYDIGGSKISTLVSGFEEAGYHQVLWNASAVPSGVYIYKIKAGEYSDTKRLVLLK
jgi:glucose/arabinose dehydrogenase